MQEPLIKPKTDFQARLLGFGAVLAGAAILNWQITGTLEDAKAGKANILYSLALIALGEMFVVLGGYWIAAGLPGYERVRALQQDPAFKRKLMIASAICLSLTWFLLNQAVSKYGYEPL